MGVAAEDGAEAGVGGAHVGLRRVRQQQGDGVVRNVLGGLFDVVHPVVVGVVDAGQIDALPVALDGDRAWLYYYLYGLERVGSLLRIPAIGVDTYVVAGASRADLKRGPGHFPETPLPGQLGNASIAGHRATHGGPFADIDQLGHGCG